MTCRQEGWLTHLGALIENSCCPYTPGRLCLLKPSLLDFSGASSWSCPFEDLNMASLDIIDHSPHHPEPSAPVATASNLVLIDNYDSFTYNVYQYLVLEGATVTVFRNDQISLEELIAKKPTQLVVSPGPGHPRTDSGVSRDAIRHFAGKIPIFGVCMGQ